MITSNTNYAYSVARIRVLETKLLKKNEIERMLGAKDANEAYKVFNDLDYASHVGEISDVTKFQEVINAGLRDIKELLMKIAPYPEVLNILWYRYDFHNIKALIRAKYNKMNEVELENDYLMQIGSYSHNLLQKFIFNAEYGEKIDQRIKEAILEAEKIYQKDQDPFLLDVYLDQQYFKIIRKLVKKINNEFLNDYLKIVIDITNIKVFFRLKINEKKSNDIEKLLIVGGDIPLSKFFEKDNQSYEQFTEGIKFTKYYEAVVAGADYYKSDNSFLTLDKQLDHVVNKLMQKTKIIPFGPEPLVVYFMAKENNAQILRAIMIGKINNVEEQIIRNRLKELYT
jgi:V/A-type H+-transporting ATPase subunit C